MAVTAAALSATRSTIVDVAKATDPSGKAAKIAEVLAQASPAFADAPYLPSNSPAGNRVTMRSTLPTVDFVRLNEGIAASKGTTKQFVDSMGIMLGRNEIDVKFKKVVTDFNAYRYQQDQAYMESIAQKAETTIFSGNEGVNESAFTGFIPRFNDVSSTATKGQFAYQVFDAGGTGSDNESIWLVDWGERACHLIYPEGTTAGIDVNDLGEEVQVLDASSRQFTAAVTEYMLTFGLSVENPRHVCRICNLDKSDLLGSTPPSLVNAIIGGLHRMVPTMGASRVLYCSPTIAMKLEQQASGMGGTTTSATGRAIGLMDWAGTPVSAFRNIPIRETDALGASEARIT